LTGPIRRPKTGNNSPPVIRKRLSGAVGKSTTNGPQKGVPVRAKFNLKETEAQKKLTESLKPAGKKKDGLCHSDRVPQGRE